MNAPAKERPILFSAPMVRALLDGTKTQTRRIVKHVAEREMRPFQMPNGKAWMTEHHRDPLGLLAVSPYGYRGDRLWVRETWGLSARNRPVYRASEDQWKPIAAEEQWVSMPAWRPSIHMPRGLSRITLTITDVRVERLDAITWEDALAEGVRSWEESLSDGHCIVNDHDPRDAYARLWESINGAGSWDANPLVWAISFEVVRGGCALPEGE